MFYSHQDDAEYHFNAQYDYNAEAYGPTARDANLAAEGDQTPDVYMTDPVAIAAFLFGGNATFTLVSLKSHTRYTFRLRNKKDGNVFFASTLTGPNNDDDYEYLGYIGADKGPSLLAGKKGKPNDVRFKALDWFLRHIMRAEFPHDAEFWHEGRCGRCNRRLTDPVSIARGLGPECAGKV